MCPGQQINRVDFVHLESNSCKAISRLAYLNKRPKTIKCISVNSESVEYCIGTLMLFLIPLLGFLSGDFTKSMGVLMKRILHSLNHSKR